MFSIRPIRIKLLIGLGLLILVVTFLSGSGLYATYSYRSLVKTLSSRVKELPVAAQLGEQVSDLRITLSERDALRNPRRSKGDVKEGVPEESAAYRRWLVRHQFRRQFEQVEETFDRYRSLLRDKLQVDSQIADNQAEWQTVHKVESALMAVRVASEDQEWILSEDKIDRLDVELAALQELVADLPSHLHATLAGFADDVRAEYRALIIGMWITSISAALFFALFLRLSLKWIISPLQKLISGTRRVAGGDFQYRIRLRTEDEMAELAEAFNDATARFQAIRDDLDRQVQERTRQVVRSEQLASVGFLAAGVAHEINNPLASIALCAESLESRVAELIAAQDPGGEHAEEVAVVANYLRMIQTEAFRCKEITEKLLDFARVGPTQRQDTELGELVRGVIEMIGHLGKYQRKNIEFDCGDPVVAAINPQEIKQVVLNLLTNALDSIEPDGRVRVALRARGRAAELIVADNGCGMEPAVLKHVFEPFFTRRRAGQGQGTGLGLAITFRIVADHGGEIEAESPGAGRGATFRVRLPMAAAQPRPGAKAA